MFQLEIIEYINWVTRLFAMIDHHCWICCCANVVLRLRSYPNHIALEKGNLRKKSGQEIPNLQGKRNTDGVEMPIWIRATLIGVLHVTTSMQKWESLKSI